MTEDVQPGKVIAATEAGTDLQNHERIMAARRTRREHGSPGNGTSPLTQEEVRTIRKIGTILDRGNNVEVRRKDGRITVYEVSKRIAN